MYSLLAVFALLTPLLAVAAPPARTADQRMLEQYRSRRTELGKSLSDGVTVIFGRREEQEDLRTGFFQEANFYYLTGWKEPGAVLLLAPLPEDQKAPGYSTMSALPRESPPSVNRCRSLSRAFDACSDACRAGAGPAWGQR